MVADIKIFHKFLPKLHFWVSKTKRGTQLITLPTETYDGGEWFTYGVFTLLQFRLFAMHIKLTWWEFRLPKGY